MAEGAWAAIAPDSRTRRPSAAATVETDDRVRCGGARGRGLLRRYVHLVGEERCLDD